MKTFAMVVLAAGAIVCGLVWENTHNLFAAGATFVVTGALAIVIGNGGED